MNPQDIPIYVRPEVSLNIMNEKLEWTGPGWLFTHESTKTSIEHLTVKITNHRLSVFQTKNFQLRDVLRTHENIRNASKEKIVKKISKETGPCCLKKLTTIVLHMKDGNVYILKQMGNTDISRVTAIMESVFFKEDWKRKHIVSNEHMKNTFGTSKF
jgi:hypothetical protein